MRTIVILSILIFISINLNSQTKFGLKLGYNTSKTDFGKNEDPQILNEEEFQAFHIGGTSHISLNKNISLGFDLFYIAKGLDAGPTFTRKLLENTSALSAIIKYEVFPKLHILGGIEFDYIFSRYFVEGLDFTNVNERNSSDNFGREFNVGPVFGIQFEFAKRWALDFRYVRIILEDTPDFDNKLFDRTFMFSVHRYFGKKI